MTECENKDCEALCGNCHMYKDNGGDSFEGNGVCKLSYEEVMACDYCSEFVCMNKKSK